MESLKRPASCWQNEGGMEPPFKRPSVEEIHMAVLKELQKISEYNMMQVSDPKYNALLRLWIALASNPKATAQITEAFFTLYRKSAVAVLSPEWESVNSTLKKNFNNAILMAGEALCSVIDHCLDLCIGLSRMANEPWGNQIWKSILKGELDVDDVQVQCCLGSELEGLTLARIQMLTQSGYDEHALCLAKCVFKFYHRVKTSENHSVFAAIKKRPSTGVVNYSTFSSVDWLLFHLQKREKLSDIIKETSTLSCHEGIHLINYLKAQIKAHVLTGTLINIFLVQDFLHPSRNCCTKEVMTLWCSYQEQQQIDLSDIADDCRRLLVSYASTSAHFYLFVDVLWEQFGSSLLSLYVEMYVRGLTADINFLEVARSNEMKDAVCELETHIASVLSKLSTLFSDGNEEVSRECMLSAFSLRPTKERLYILQSLTHSILSQSHHCRDTARNTVSNSNYLEKYSKSGCNYGSRCSKISRITNFSHPLLLTGIKGISYSIVKDLVSLLEGVRCNIFQFNSFDWKTAASDLGDYLNHSQKNSSRTEVINECNKECNPLKRTMHLESYVRGSNFLKDSTLVMPEGLHARSIPFQQFSTVPLKEVKTSLSNFVTGGQNKLPMESSSISSTSYENDINISLPLNSNHSNPSICAAAATKNITEANYLNGQGNQISENLILEPENLQIPPAVPMHYEKALVKICSKKSHSKPIIFNHDTNNLNNSVSGNDSISPLERNIINSATNSAVPFNKGRSSGPQYHVGSSHIHNLPHSSYSRSASSYYPPKIEKNATVVGSKQPSSSNIPDASIINSLPVVSELPMNYSCHQPSAESINDSHVVRKSPTFRTEVNGSCGKSPIKEYQALADKNFLPMNKAGKNESVLVSDVAENARSHGCVGTSCKSADKRTTDGDNMKTIELNAFQSGQSSSQNVLYVSSQEVHTQLPRIPVSVNPVTRMTLEQLSSPQEKTFSIPAFKINMTREIRKLSVKRLVSANLVIPRDSNSNTLGSNKVNGALLPIGSSSNAISIPGVIIFKSSKDKFFLPPLKVEKPNNESSENADHPQKRMWSSYRSTFGEMGWKKTGQRSSSMSSPLQKVQSRPSGKMPYVLFSQKANGSIISKHSQNSSEKQIVSSNNTINSPILSEHRLTNSNVVESLRPVSSPMPSIVQTGSLSSNAIICSEPSSIPLPSRTPCVISLDGKALQGKLVSNDGHKNLSPYSSNFGPAFPSSVVHNPSLGSNAFANVQINVASLNINPKQNVNVNLPELKMRQSLSPMGCSTKHEQSPSDTGLPFQSFQKMCCSSSEVLPCQSCSHIRVNNYGTNMQTSEANFMPQQVHATYTAGSNNMDIEDSAHVHHVRSNSIDSNKKKRLFQKNWFIKGKSSYFARKTCTRYYKMKVQYLCKSSLPNFKVLVKKSNMNRCLFSHNSQIKNCPNHFRDSVLIHPKKYCHNDAPVTVLKKNKHFVCNSTDVSSSTIKHCKISIGTQSGKLGGGLKTLRVELQKINISKETFSESFGAEYKKLSGPLTSYAHGFSREKAASKPMQHNSYLTFSSKDLKHAVNNPVVLLQKLSIKIPETAVNTSAFPVTIPGSNPVVYKGFESKTLTPEKVILNKAMQCNSSLAIPASKLKHKCREPVHPLEISVDKVDNVAVCTNNIPIANIRNNNFEYSDSSAVVFSEKIGNKSTPSSSSVTFSSESLAHKFRKPVVLLKRLNPKIKNIAEGNNFNPSLNVSERISNVFNICDYPAFSPKAKLLVPLKYNFEFNSKKLLLKPVVVLQRLSFKPREVSRINANEPPLTNTRDQYNEKSNNVIGVLNSGTKNKFVQCNFCLNSCSKNLKGSCRNPVVLLEKIQKFSSDTAKSRFKIEGSDSDVFTLKYKKSTSRKRHIVSEVIKNNKQNIQDNIKLNKKMRFVNYKSAHKKGLLQLFTNTSSGIEHPVKVQNQLANKDMESFKHLTRCTECEVKLHRLPLQK